MDSPQTEWMLLSAIRFWSVESVALPVFVVKAAMILIFHNLISFGCE
jgi:hypothetical protein